MATEVIRELKLLEAQLSQYPGLESDSFADVSFFFGDLNYRLDSNYEYLSTHMEETKKQSLD
jgi:hypothetical protein